MPEEHPELASVLARVERWGASRTWIGPDPYEGLNSPLGRLAPSRRPRQAVIQLYKNLPFAPPWPLRAPQRANAKALALALSGYATPAGRKLRGAAEYLERLPRELERMNLLEEGAGWGYHFDLQTRHLYYFGSAPNAIATSFVVDSLIDASRETHSDLLTQLALASRSYLLSLLSAKTDGSAHRFFMYVSSGSRLIHNANALVCGTLARLHELSPDEEARVAVFDALPATLNRQHLNGLWPYGEGRGLTWADNFHTAYVLQGLVRTARVYGVGADALQRGLDAWRRNFFGGRSQALYYPGREFPLEAHSYASAIDLVCLEEPSAERLEFARAIATAAIQDLWLADEGRFAFRRTRYGLNRRTFMRWTNAPMFRALATLCSAPA